ncbi:MAG: hypothetical protein FWF24_06125 [Alphaproteobacteria bacterium]|nr:hypothetical protein [Alphaproteobacteria bacterium]
MRFYLLQAVCLSFILCLLGQNVLAQGVLVPEDDVSYGLTPTRPAQPQPEPEPEPQPAPQPAPAPAPQPTQPQMQEDISPADQEAVKESEAKAQALIKQSMPTNTRQDGVTVKLTPGGRLPPKAVTEEDKMIAALLEKGQTLPQQRSDHPIFEAIRKFKDLYKKQFERPPNFLDAPVSRAFQSSDMKGSFTVGVMGDFMWGEKDLEKLEKTLGLAREAVPQSCQIRLRVTVQTTDGKPFYKLDLFTGEQGTLNFNGTVTGLESRAFAFCVKPASFPQNGSTILRLGAYYGVMLAESSCAAGKNTFLTNAGVRYDGDGKISCAFK